VASLEQSYAANLTTQLESLGASGGSLGSDVDVRNTFPVPDYTFSGVTNENETVSGGAHNLASSENDSDQYVTTTTTYTETEPVYTLERTAGNSYFVSVDSLATDTGGNPIGPPGANVTPVDEEVTLPGGGTQGPWIQAMATLM
jgi:hypothetical protein